jgi:asparagine synthase (glutamine-hydrolysing)
MCGIAGYIAFDQKNAISSAAIERIKQYLKFRGPDANGNFSIRNKDTHGEFIHTRLSIIDLSDSANQPMIGASGNTLVFNGEIYNYRELKEALKAEGIQFKTNSDTEVILQGFSQWGMDSLVRRLDGMFALAIYAFNENKLYLARDRFGKKPLLYKEEGKRVIFGSDIRIFHEFSAIKDIDPTALGYYFSELTTPEPHTIWRGIKKIPPGTYLVFEPTGCSLERIYWTPFTEHRYSEATFAENVHRADLLLTRAVEKRLVADVNVAGLLSGGIDSSLVVAKMAELTTKPVRTYSVAFEDEEFNESHYAQEVAKKFGTNHREILLSSLNFDTASEIILAYGEPFADVSMIPTYLICKAIAAHEKVVLGGDGGDELFAGYHNYYFAHKFDIVRRFGFLAPIVSEVASRIPSYRLTFLSELLAAANRAPSSFLDRRMGFSANEIKNLLPSNTEAALACQVVHEYRWHESFDSKKSTLRNLMLASLRTRLLNDYLVKVDRASMFASLEMRSPFMDRDLAEFSFILSDRDLMKPYGTKSVLKSIALRYFSPSFVHRKKMGFGVPISRWFRHELRHLFESTVFGKRQQLIEIDYNFLQKLWSQHCSGADYGHKMWAVLVFHIWAQNRNDI